MVVVQIFRSIIFLIFFVCETSTFFIRSTDWIKKMILDSFETRWIVMWTRTKGHFTTFNPHTALELQRLIEKHGRLNHDRHHVFITIIL